MNVLINITNLKDNVESAKQIKILATNVPNKIQLNV